jgi:hypothetical protein
MAAFRLAITLRQPLAMQRARSGASTLRREGPAHPIPRRRTSVLPDPSLASRSAIIGWPVGVRHDQSIGHTRLEMLEHGGLAASH